MKASSCRMRNKIALCLWILSLVTLYQWRLIFWWHQRTGEAVEQSPLHNHDHVHGSSSSWATTTKMTTTPFHRKVNLPHVPHSAILWVVFYHIYIPAHSSERASKALSIVKEQLDQIRTSHAAKIQQQEQYDNQTLILYSTIGQRILPETMTEMCQPELRCVNIQSLGSGFEDKTLRKLHAYCTQQSNNNATTVVTYIHNKGSHHSRQGANDFWRRHMTMAVTSRECYEAVVSPQQQSSSSSCNACALLFQSIPSLHFPGNFWTVSCDYIQKLRPISAFYTKLEEESLSLMDEFTAQGVLTRNLYDSTANWTTGRGRYGAEQWIASHPDVRPCDVSSTPDLRFWQSEQRSLSDFDWRMVPRRTLLHKNWQIQPRPNQNLLKDGTKRLRDYHLLPGLLTRWWTLYESLPSSDSWVWQHFPDGQHWRDLVEKVVLEHPTINKNDTLLLKKLLTSSPPTPEKEPMEPPAHASAPWTSFYHVYVSSDRNVSHIVEEQLSTLQQSYAATSVKDGLTVYYSLVGKAQPDVVAEICARHDKLHCKVLQQALDGSEDITLAELHEFCQKEPNQTVVYFHSKGSFHDSVENEHWRRHLLSAVTGPDCLESMQSTEKESNNDEICDVCGLQFYPLWAFFFPGNFFVGRCSYIGRLLKPADYADGISEVVQEMIDRKRNNLLKTDLYSPKKEGNLGLDRYAWEQWVASHPSIRSCDLSKTANFRHWVQPHSEPDLLWSMAPRHDIWAPWYRIQTGKREEILANPSRRMREYFLLAGMHMKWLHLYNTTPSNESWVYKWFPDGSVWRDGVKAYGNIVVDVLTQQFRDKPVLNGTLESGTSGR